MNAEVYKDKSGAWRWRLRHRNGQIVACSGESFASRRNAIRSVVRLIRAVRETASASPVVTIWTNSGQVWKVWDYV